MILINRKSKKLLKGTTWKFKYTAMQYFLTEINALIRANNDEAQGRIVDRQAKRIDYSKLHENYSLMSKIMKSINETQLLVITPGPE